MFELSNELALSFEKIGLYFFIFIISIQTLFIFWSFITSFDFCKRIYYIRIKNINGREI